MDLEDFNRDVATPILQEANADMTRLRAENERLQSELTALRRPVDQSAELSEICSRIDAGNGLWSDVPKLRAALDAAQREIARLSSPPEERAEIVESYRAAILKPKGASLYLAEQAGLIEDVGTLLGDCAAWRNALAVSNATIKDLRQRIERLEAALRACKPSKDRDLAEAQHMLILANSNADAFRRVAEQRQGEIERLRRAVEWCLSRGVRRTPGGRFVSDLDLDIQVPAEFAVIIKPTTGASNG